MRYLCESVIPKWFWFFRISAIISSYCVQKLIASSRWSNFTHKDTEKNRKIQNFKIVLNCRETDARVSSAKIRGLQSLKLENDGMGTGLKWIHDPLYKFCIMSSYTVRLTLSWLMVVLYYFFGGGGFIVRNHTCLLTRLVLNKDVLNLTQ